MIRNVLPPFHKLIEILPVEEELLQFATVREGDSPVREYPGSLQVTDGPRGDTKVASGILNGEEARRHAILGSLTGDINLCFPCLER